MEERWKEWLCIFVTTLFLPGMITLLISGTEKKENTPVSGITIEYDNGEKVDMEEFLLYMVAGQISLDSEKEALKAQAVIGRTNLLRELNGKTEAKASELSVTYLSPEKFNSSFGERSREETLKKIKQAVEETYGQAMVYEGNYIEALYHQVSIGTTVSAKEYFCKDRPYLAAVESSQDVESEEYMTMKTQTAEEVLQILQKEGKAQLSTKDNILSSLKVLEKTENGYVKTVAVGTETLSGDEWKNLFGLNSTNFYLEEYEDHLRTIVLGKGHGVGMSQYGANALAKEGWDYKAILEKYYPGISFAE